MFHVLRRTSGNLFRLVTARDSQSVVEMQRRVPVLDGYGRVERVDTETVTLRALVRRSPGTQLVAADGTVRTIDCVILVHRDDLPETGWFRVVVDGTPFRPVKMDREALDPASPLTRLYCTSIR